MNNSPYPGLRPFRREEAHLFFGREEQTFQLLEKLSDTRFISVVGLSGCGKSSLVRAGLIPALESGLLLDASSHWRAVEMRSGNHPMQNLAEALLTSAVSDLAGVKPPKRENRSDVDAVPFLLASLYRGPLSLVEIFHETPLPEHTNLLLLVDQFEELFRYHRQGGRDEAEAFIALLLASVNQEEIPIYVVTTMRSEFIGDCALFYDLPEIMNRGQFLTPRLTRDQQREAIVEPAKEVGGTIEPRLVNSLLNEMGTDPDQLPLLQHCLMRMWFQVCGEQNEVLRNEINITLEDYEAVGGLKNALSNHADEAFEELDEKEQHIAEVLFRRLSERGAGLRDTRRPTPLSEVASVAGVSKEEVVRVVEVFRRSDRCFITPPASERLGSNPVLDISHESLIRQWERLNKWVEEEAESARMYIRLEDATGRWAQGKAALWRDPDLTLATQWKDREKPTSTWASRYGKDFDLAKRFLDASAKAQEEKRQQEEQAREEKRQQEERIREMELRRVRQQRKMFAIVGVLLGVALLAVANFWIKAREQADIAIQAQSMAEEQAHLAEEQKQNAQRQARFARSAELAAQAQNVFETYPQRSLLLAVEALNVTLQEGEPRIPSAEEVLREVLAHTRGRGLGERIDDVVISPDGQWLVTVSQNEFPKLWRFRDGELAADPVVLSDSKLAENLIISSDSHWLVAWGQNKIIGLWDLKATDPAASLNTLTGHDQEITAVAFSPDSQRLATGSWDTTVRLWDLSDLSATPLVLQGHKAAISQITLSANNRWMMTRSNDGVVLLWELKGDRANIVYNYENISTDAFSPDNRWMITGNYDGTVWLRDLKNPDNDPVVLLGHDGTVVDMVMSPDNHWLIARSYNGSARLWDLTVSDQSSEVLSETGITSVTVSLDSHWLITGNEDGTLGLWDLTATTTTSRILRGHEGPVDRLSIAADSHWLVTGSEDGTARLWDLRFNSQGGTPLLLSGHKAGISSVAISSDNHRVATGSKDGTARLWNVMTGDSSANSIVLSGVEGEDVYTLAISPDDRWLVTGHEDGTLRLWNVSGTNPSSTTLWEESTNASVSVDGHWVVAGSEDGTIRRWDLTVADPATSLTILLQQEQISFPMAISSNTRWLVTGNKDGTMQLWDLTSASSSTLLSEEYVTVLCFSPDSHRLITVNEDGTMLLWDLTGNIPEPTSLTLHGHEGCISAVALSPDNRWLVTGGEDSTVRLWDLTADGSTRTAVVLRGHEQPITSIAISANSRRLVTGSEDGTARMWRLQVNELIELACRTAGRNLSLAEWEKYFPGEKYYQTCPDLPVHWSFKENDKQE